MPGGHADPERKESPSTDQSIDPSTDQSTVPPPEIVPRICKTCGEEPEKIDSLNRPMGVCGKCLALRGKKNLELGTKASWPAFYIPINDPKYIEIKEWLEKEAKEFEQDLSRAVMYQLKLAHRAIREKTT